VQILEPQTRLQWISHFNTIDRVVKESGPMLRSTRVSKTFGILHGLCGNKEVAKSLEPFQQEYLQTRDNLKKTHNRTSSMSSIGDAVIASLLLNKVEDDLAILEEIGNGAGVDHHKEPPVPGKVCEFTPILTRAPSLTLL
jgi:hypothetical protein